MTAFRPEPQTALMVSAGTLCGRPLLITDWRAGFWPEPAVSTWPRMTSLIWSAITVAPSSGAAILASEPPNLPTGVRAAATMTMSLDMEGLLRTIQWTVDG